MTVSSKEVLPRAATLKAWALLCPAGCGEERLRARTVQVAGNALALVLELALAAPGLGEVQGGPSALARDARAHAAARLNLRQIAKKISLTQERVRTLLGDEAPRAKGPRRRKRAPWAPWRRS